MRSPRDLRLVAFVAHLLALKCCSAHFTAYNITIPASYKVTSEDEYVCTVLELPKKGHKMIGVQPMADQKIVHHILLFGGRAGRPPRLAAGTSSLRCRRPVLRRSELFPQARARPRPAGCATPHMMPTEEDQQPAWNCQHAPTCARGGETIM
jgi:hypothetical protein